MRNEYTLRIKVINRDGEVKYHNMHYNCMVRDIMEFVYDKYGHYDYEEV